MSTQLFEITGTPEEPLTPEMIKKLLWYVFPNSEWDVQEVDVDDREPGGMDA